MLSTSCNLHYAFQNALALPKSSFHSMIRFFRLQSGISSLFTLIILLLFGNLQSQIPGAALDFDGVDDRVEIADASWNDFGSGSFTIEFWVKKQSSTVAWSNVASIGKWNTGALPGTNEWTVSLTSDGSNQLPAFVVEVGTASYQVVGTTPLVTDTWYHLAAVRKTDTLRLYVNGMLEGTLINPGITSINNVAGRQIIMGRIAGFAGHTNMEMDEVRIWNVARTESEIRLNRNCEITYPRANLLAYYRYNQGEAAGNNAAITSLADLSGSNRNGNLQNFALSGTTSNWVSPGGVSALPQLRTNVNTVELQNNNDGTDETAIVNVCNSATDNLNFLPFADVANASPAANVKVIQQFTLSNVNFAPPNGVFLLSVYSPAFTRNVSLVNTSLPGNLIMRFRIFYDIDNDDILDDDEWANDWIQYTVNISSMVKPGITPLQATTYVCEGGAGTTLSVAATGPVLSYQWQRYNTGTSTFQNVSGATNASLFVTGPILTEDRYRVVVFTNTGLSCQDSSLSNVTQLRFVTDEGLACNKLINISLGEECELIVDHDLILEGNYGHDLFSVQILDELGRPIGNIINSGFVNKKWSVKVINNCNGNSCWGQILVEDKLPPVILCRPDTLINCYDSTDFAKPPFLPRASDNCNPDIPVSVIFNEVLPYKNCTTDTIAVRTIRYRPHNATATCERKIYYRRANINDILIPKNYDGMPGNHLPLSCSYAWETGIKNRYPDPHETGSPYFPGYNPLSNGIFINNICKIQVTYRDEMTNGTCLGIKVILRRWTIMDWCTRVTREETQIIKIIDDSGPEFDIPSIPVMKTSAHKCTSTIIAPKPQNVFDCSGNNHYSYKVEFRLDPDCITVAESGSYTLISGEIRSELMVSGPDAGKWRISGLPVGCTWLRYTLIDSCGNTSIKYSKVNINDGVAPVAICDENTIVTLSPDGKATVYARSVDDGSHDDCSQVSLKIRRMTPGCEASTSIFTDFIDICCDDRIVVAEMLVTDKSSNSTVCMANIHVQDKIIPTIVCPPNITIGCTADTSALATGLPKQGKSNPNGGYFFDNCPNLLLTWRNAVKINECGEGAIRRTYTVTDHTGNTNSCAHTITIRNATPFTGPSWSDVDKKIIEGCMYANTDPSVTGKPKYNTLPCSKVVSTYSDKIFYSVEGVCYKIERTWSVVDWCKFRTEGDTITYRWPGVITETVNKWTHKQIIHIIDNTKPVISMTNSGRAFSVGDNNCLADLGLLETATDCNPAATQALKWSYEVRRGSVLYKTGSGTGGALNARGDYQAGTYLIEWRVEDQCGNAETKSYPFTVVDNKKPSPYCLSTVTTVVMPSAGSVGINARAFNLGSFDNCSGPLIYSFSNTYPAQIADSVRTFTCSDFAIGQDTIHRTLQMYVWDQSRNSDFCAVKVIVQKNAACTASGSKSDLTIGGNITNEMNQKLEDVSVYLTDDGSMSKMQLTNSNGMYAFGKLPADAPYTIKPEKNDDPLNGISTLDLVMIQQHILGLNPFNNPYQYMAADANNDKKVTAADLTEVRKLILGINTNFTKSNSWRFYDRGQKTPDLVNPWTLNETIFIDKKHGDVMNNDFLAIKTGDVNLSAKTAASSVITESRRESGKLNIDNKTFAKNQKVIIPVTAKNISDIRGLQLFLDYDDSKLLFKSIIPGALEIDSDSYNGKNGHIAVSWFSKDKIAITNDRTLFALEFESMDMGDVQQSIILSNSTLKSEYYSANNVENDLKLLFNKLYLTAHLEVGQNAPNPFSATTVISVLMPISGSAILNLYDQSGKLILKKEEEFNKGKNEFIIQHQELSTPGMYFYEVKSLGQSFMKKLIKISE